MDDIPASQAAAIDLHSCWTFEVPEIFPDPEQFYIWLTFGRSTEEVPSLLEMRPILERIFATYATQQGLAQRFRRFLWKAVIA